MSWQRYLAGRLRDCAARRQGRRDARSRAEADAYRDAVDRATRARCPLTLADDFAACADAAHGARAPAAARLGRVHAYGIAAAMAERMTL